MDSDANHRIHLTFDDLAVAEWGVSPTTLYLRANSRSNNENFDRKMLRTLPTKEINLFHFLSLSSARLHVSKRMMY